MEGESVEIYQHYQTKLSKHLLKHQMEMLQFLYFTNYDIVYQSFEAGSYYKRKGQVETAFKSEEIMRYFESISEKLHLRLGKNNIELDKKLCRLEVSWHNRGIPYFHRYYFSKYVITAHFKNLEQILDREFDMIRNQSHIYFPILQAIKARQACLRQMKRSLAQLGENDIYEYLHSMKERLFQEHKARELDKYAQKGYAVKNSKVGELTMSKTALEEFGDKFTHLSKMTIYVLELIMRWKEYIYSLTHDKRRQQERVEFYFYDDNYLLKILTDLGFLRVSFLHKYYDFAPRNDPFMLRPVLQFQKSQEHSQDHTLLKMVFMPAEGSLAEIMKKIEYLAQQYKNNIRSRKAYNSNPLKKYNKKQQKHDSFKEPVSNAILKKIQTAHVKHYERSRHHKKQHNVQNFEDKGNGNTNKRIVQEDERTPSGLLKPQNKETASIKNFRRRTLPVKKDQKIIIELQARRKKRVTSYPDSPRMLIEKDQPQSKLLHNANTAVQSKNLLNSELLNSLKSQIIRQVRQDHGPSSVHAPNEALQLYIDAKIKEAIKGLFPKPQKIQKKFPLQFSQVHLLQQQIPQEIRRIRSKTPRVLQEMQPSQEQVLKHIYSSPFVYFIQATQNTEQLGQIICAPQNESSYKVLNVLYVGIYDFSILQELMSKFVQYIEQYQTALQISYVFYQPLQHENIQEIIDDLEKGLKCLVASKQNYLNTLQVRFVFQRKEKITKNIPNHFPLSLSLKLYALLSNSKVKLERESRQRRHDEVGYDYMLMEMIRRFIQVDDLLILKEKVPWKQRMRLILQAQTRTEAGLLCKPQLFEANNISQLGMALLDRHKNLLEASDLTKNNSIKLLTLDLKLTPTFPAKCVLLNNGTKYYRYIVRAEKQCWKQNEIIFYPFSVEEKPELTLVFFSGKRFVQEELFRIHQRYLLNYLSSILLQLPSISVPIDHFWMPMCRLPRQYQERQDIYLETFRSYEFEHLGKDILIGQQLEYFYGMQMQNSIEYSIRQNDVALQEPYGLAVLDNQSKTIVYARIIH